MSEEKIAGIVRDFFEEYVKRDVEKTLSFLTEDVVWVQPEGTFKGKGEVKRLFAWLPKSFWWSQVKFRNAGVGILVKGNKAIYEYIIDGVGLEGVKYEAPAVSIFEFSGEKIQHHRVLCDRMTVGKQGCKGTLGIGRTVIREICNTWEKGLR